MAVARARTIALNAALTPCRAVLVGNALLRAVEEHGYVGLVVISNHFSNVALRIVSSVDNSTISCVARVADLVSALQCDSL
jgi:hypothetical protein